MTVEATPLKNACNIQCTYCYEKFMRVEEKPETYSIEKMLQSIDKENVDFTMFGGEPLLVPLEDLEKFFAHGFEKYGKNGIQTNGTLITSRHIDLFRRYNVHVGISVDGPEFLNDNRRVGSLDNTRKMTGRTIDAIKDLCYLGMVPSLIVTLHKMNASSERLPYLLRWFSDLEKVGIKNIRVHFLENDDVNELVLTEDELFTALTSLMELKLKINLDLYDDMFSLLTEENPKISCTWGGCDPYTTPAVHGVGPQGELHNCGRTNKDGKDYIKADSHGSERVQALYYTPQEFGGCKGCRFFYACKGHCPGESSDWRNRTSHCGVIKRIFTYLENELIKDGKVPISLLPQRVVLEKRVLNERNHGDSPHIDEHGDSYFFEVEDRTIRLRTP